jgi:hypothetical protein
MGEGSDVGPQTAGNHAEVLAHPDLPAPGDKGYKPASMDAECLTWRLCPDAKRHKRITSNPRKDILPGPFAASIGIFSFEGRLQVDHPQAFRKLRHVLLFHARQVLSECFLNGLRQDRHPVLLPFPISYHDLILSEIHTLHP